VVRGSWILVGVVLAAVLAGCGSSQETATLTPEQRYAKAKALFDDRDYLEAINEFTVITLQYQGSAYAADAQYFIAESRFERAEYLLAAFEYSVVKRNYPASARVADAAYKSALSYYMLSPKSSLDQQYTKKAIDEFQSFAEYYPTHSLAAEAAQKIKELTNRLAKKQYETARLYATMEYYKAATLSYDVIIEKYHDTEYAPLAVIEKAELLFSRKRYTEARTEVHSFLSKFPNSVLRARAEALNLKIDERLQSSPANQQPADKPNAAAPNKQAGT
jgi:outer membrane protein assembly factor BamD